MIRQICKVVLKCVNCSFTPVYFIVLNWHLTLLQIFLFLCKCITAYFLDTFKTTVNDHYYCAAVQ